MEGIYIHGRAKDLQFWCSSFVSKPDELPVERTSALRWEFTQRQLLSKHLGQHFGLPFPVRNESHIRCSLHNGHGEGDPFRWRLRGVSDGSDPPVFDLDEWVVWEERAAVAVWSHSQKQEIQPWVTISNGHHPGLCQLPNAHLVILRSSFGGQTVINCVHLTRWNWNLQGSTFFVITCNYDVRLEKYLAESNLNLFLN